MMTSRTTISFWLLPVLLGLPILADATEPDPVAPTPPAMEFNSKQQEEAMAQVRNHLKNAMRALGEAGRLTYESQMPILQDKTEEALKEAQHLLKELEQRLLSPKEDKKSAPIEKKIEDGMTSI